jgi:putative tryptophan/tyrosine transport system substrate-binding protein
MRRREFITLVGGAAPWSLAAHAQQARKTPRIGVLWPNPPSTFEFLRQGLSDFGYVQGRNIEFEFRWAEGKLDQLPELAAELVRLQVDIIVTLAPQATLAAKHATQTIPIVFVAMGDPLSSGVVDSLARPDANLTGTTRMISEMSAKHVELLKEAVPSLLKLAVLWNPTNSSHASALQAAQVVGRSLSLHVYPLEVRTPAELDSVFGAILRERVDGVLFIADPIFFIHLKRMVDLTTGNRLPNICNFIEFPRLGGLVGYAPSIPDEFRHAASHIDKILKGAKPGDLPVEQPTKFQLVINAKTAKALGLEIPPTLLARADELIE